VEFKLSQYDTLKLIILLNNFIQVKADLSRKLFNTLREIPNIDNQNTKYLAETYKSVLYLNASTIQIKTSINYIIQNPNRSMKILKIFLFTLIFSMNLSYSQSKKEQIIYLNNKIDSLNIVLSNKQFKIDSLKNISTDKQSKIDSLISSNFDIAKQNRVYMIEIEKKLKNANDSLLMVINKNENLQNKIGKLSEIIELFNNTLTIDIREFDVHKDSKLFAQYLFLDLLYNGDKMDGYFSSTYFGVVYGNRLLNAKITDSEKIVFHNEYLKYMKYIGQNFIEFETIESENYYFNNLQNEINNLSFDEIINELNQIRPAFEPNVNLPNDINRIKSLSRKKTRNNTRKFKVKL
jgi:hypothetical protein